jgi:hypothetical protein
MDSSIDGFITNSLVFIVGIANNNCECIQSARARDLLFVDHRLFLTNLLGKLSNFPCFMQEETKIQRSSLTDHSEYFRNVFVMFPLTR